MYFALGVRECRAGMSRRARAEIHERRSEACEAAASSRGEALLEHLPLASPPSPSGVVASCVWAMAVHRQLGNSLAGLSLSAKEGLPTDRVEFIDACSLGYRDRPQLRLRADKLPSPNHCGLTFVRV